MRRSYFKKGDWNAICDTCLCEFKASQLRETWDGRMVCREDWETRHPQEFARGIPDNPSVPWTRKEVLPADQQANSSGIIIPSTITDPSFQTPGGTDAWVIIDPDTGDETSGVGDNWIIAGGKATHIVPPQVVWNIGPYQEDGMDSGAYQTAAATDGTEHEITQSFNYIAGETYTVSLALSNMTYPPPAGGSARAVLGGAVEVLGTERTENGYYQEDLVALESSNEFTIRVSEDFDGDIKLVQVVKKIVYDF